MESERLMERGAKENLRHIRVDYLQGVRLMLPDMYLIPKNSILLKKTISLK